MIYSSSHSVIPPKVSSHFSSHICPSATILHPLCTLKFSFNAPSLWIFFPFGINFCPTISHYGIFISRVLHSLRRDICPTKSRRPWPARDLHRWPLEMLMRLQRHRTCFPLIYFASICSYVDRSDGLFTYLNFFRYLCLFNPVPWLKPTYIHSHLSIFYSHSLSRCLCYILQCDLSATRSYPEDFKLT